MLIIIRDKDGNFVTCEARWVLQGFLDKQKDDQQTDSPTASRPGFRLLCQFAASMLYDLFQCLAGHPVHKIVAEDFKV